MLTERTLRIHIEAICIHIPIHMNYMSKFHFLMINLNMYKCCPNMFKSVF